jgi:glycosyltransferase involved in cell wall biosynthesis
MAGKPVVHAVNAGNDPVAEAGAGISTEPYNPGKLDSALRTFVAMGPAERERMGRRGRQYAMENLDWNVLGARYVTLCEGLMREKKGRAS